MYDLNRTRLDEIALLAESVARENFRNGKTDLYGITSRLKISIIEGNYEDYFIGNLLHESGNFFLYLNMDALSLSQESRIRFTIAHELGHYFIDQHRNRLKEGDSLSFVSSFPCSGIEKEANHFASFLLMPRSKFLKRASKMEAGLSSILKLSSDFGASIEATAIHYSKIDAAPVLIVRWDENSSVKYAFYSNTLLKDLKLPKRLAILKPTEYINGLQFQANAVDGPQILENASLLSKWIANIPKGSDVDLVALEETIKLGKYGGLTVITYSK
jgi:Zn-dependent peptidase ImmA (M78 family)